MYPRALAVPAALGTLVAALAAAIGSAPVRAADRAASFAAVAFERGHPDVATVTWAVTELGGTVAAAAVLLAVASWPGVPRRWAASGFAALALLVPGPLVEAVKHLVGRARPHPPAALAHFGGLSFPSGHSAHVAADVALLWLLLPGTTGWIRRAVLVVGVAVVLAVGCSRVALGAHYPTDVLAGWALGVAWVTGVAATGAGKVWSARGVGPPGGRATRN